MKKTILLILFLSVNLHVYSQLLRGTILDKQTHKRIPDGLVYFSGTFVRSNPDKEGRFVIDLSEFGTMPVTISAPGYYSATFSIAGSGKPVVISLAPKASFPELAASGKKSSEKDRRENMRLFRNTFLGTSQVARTCSILNEDDISFQSDNDTLRAFSPEPILVENPLLGYKFVYYLDEFVLNRRKGSFIISGSTCFVEDYDSERAGTGDFRLKRDEAYKGSRMFFFRTLWSNSFDSAKFIIKNSKDEDLSYDQLVFQDDSLRKYLRCPGGPGTDRAAGSLPYYVVFNENEIITGKNGKPDPSSFSILTFESDVYFDRNGYFDPAAVSWEGKMARQRSGDQLPYEYK